LGASGEVVWVGAGARARDSGRVALYFREDAPMLGPPTPPGLSVGGRGEPPGESEHELLRERLAAAPCFFADLLAELELSVGALTQALWDLVWAGEITNDAWAPLRAPRLALAAPGAAGGRSSAGGGYARRRFGGHSLRGGRFSGAGAQVQGRWSLTSPIFGERSSRGTSSNGHGDAEGPRRAGELGERRRALAELLLERYGVLTREQVLAEGIAGGFSSLYGALSELETLGVCRRGYFIEGLGGAQFALPGAVERLRSKGGESGGMALVLAAVDPAQPFGATLPWPRREGQARRPARVAGAYVVIVDGEPVLYLERGGRGIVTLCSEEMLLQTESQARGLVSSGSRGGASGRAPLMSGLRELADAVRGGRVDAVALERVDGEPAIGSRLEPVLVELGFRQGPRRLTLRA
jgi:ATP-dependent Lhr-like helicase